MEYYNKKIARNRDVEFIHYNLDETEKAMKNFVLDFEFPWPAITYAEREKVKFAHALKGARQPSFVLVDAHGKVLALGEDGSKKEIAKLAAKAPEEEKKP